MERNGKPVFDMTINLGHVLTFVGFIVTGSVAFQNLDKRVVSIEQNVAYQVKRDEVQDLVMRENRSDIKDALKDVHTSLEKLSDKIDAVAEQSRKQRQ